MWQKLRQARSPGWIVFHLVTVALIVTMALLGRWQLDVSNAKHFNLQNFGYALQWWAFVVFTVVLWFRVVRDNGMPGLAGPSDVDRTEAHERPGVEPDAVQYRRYVMPSVADAAPASDPVLGAYNDYLAGLAAADETQRRDAEPRDTEGTAR